MRSLQRELEARQVKDICREGIQDTRQELERSAAYIQEQEEMKRLRDLMGEDYRQPQPQIIQPPPVAYAYSSPDYEAELSRRRMQLEQARLKLLQEKIRLKQEENERLRSMLYASSYQPQYTGYSAPPQQQAPPIMPQYPPVPQQVIVQPQQVPMQPQQAPMQPVQISIQTATPPQAPAQSQDTIPVAQDAYYDSDELILMPNGSVVFDGNIRLTFAEAYKLLSDEHKSYCNGILAYACKQSNEDKRESKYHVSVGCGANQVIKLSIKNGVLIAACRTEDERLRQIRLANLNTSIKTQETIVKVIDEDAYNMTKALIDLRIVQIAEDIDFKKQLKKERLREKRLTDRSKPNA